MSTIYGDGFIADRTGPDTIIAEASTRREDERAAQESICRDAARYRWLKTASKEQFLLWRGAFGCSDESIDAAMAEPPARPSPEHVCGLQGYNPMIDPPCPGCEARNAQFAAQKETAPAPLGDEG